MAKLWAEENDQEDIITRFLCKKLLFSGKSPYQKIEIYDTPRFGKVLLNDNIIMITEKDEFVYHEMISHVPMFLHPNPKNVLIIGGGDGGTAREILKHPSVELCKMVEIDEMVVQACKEHIPQTACSFSNPKLDLIIDDGVRFVKETKLKFDIVIVDSTDPIGPAVPLFGEEFYKNVFRILNEEGVVSAQGESPFYNKEAQIKLLQITKNIFPIHTFYNYGNMSYPGGLWSFLFASKKLHPLKDFKKERVLSSGMSLQYYHPGIHKASFEQPEFVKKIYEIGLP